MKEGAWINARTGQYWWCSEHADFAKSEAGADAMGLPSSVRARIAPMVSDGNGPGRAEICITVMKAGYVRFRGHGTQFTCEFWGNVETNLMASFEFLQKMCGDFTYCIITNLENGDSSAMRFADLRAQITSEPNKILRIATSLLHKKTREVIERMRTEAFGPPKG